MVRSGRAAGILAVIMLCGCGRHPPLTAVETRLQLGLQYLATGSYAAAERNLRRAMQAAPEDYRPVLGLAQLYQTQGHDAMAIVWYTRAEQLAPENGYVLNNYGAFLCSLGQYDKAQSRFLLATPDMNAESRGQAQLLSGFCFLDEGKTAPARENIASVVSTDRSAADKLLAEASRRMEQQKFADTKLLLEIYHQYRSASAESLWLKILYAAQQDEISDVKRYGDQLARTYPLSIQYQRYLANEY